MTREIYRRLKENKAPDIPPLVGATNLQRAQSALGHEPANPGLQIMVNCYLAGLTLPADMDRLVTTFKQVVEQHFRWDPGHAGSNGADVLDGAKDHGECAFLAHALYELMKAPAPYGFAVAAGPGFGVETYLGASGDGFVATHAGQHYGLASNTIDPMNQARRDLYRWGDHKVVQYHGRYWDQCYDAEYANLADMAYYDFTTATMPNGWPNPNFIFTGSRGVATRYFILNDRHQTQAWATTIGPYTNMPPPPPGNAAPQHRRRYCCSGMCVIV